MDFKDTGSEGLDWVDLAQDSNRGRAVNEPRGCIREGELLTD